MYIKTIKINQDNRCLKQGLNIEARQLTLLVGDQGAGKSTVLQGLAQLGQAKESFLSVELTPEGEKGVESYYFDSEKHNPRIKDPHLFSTADGKDSGIGFSAALKSRFKSHGEVIKEFTVNPIAKAENCIVTIDEPESGLSIRNQYKLVSAIKTAMENKTQFFIATHCLPLIQAVEQVYSMEHLKWMDSKEFVQTQTA
jgi:predicted ATPase